MNTSNVQGQDQASADVSTTILPGPDLVDLVNSWDDDFSPNIFEHSEATSSRAGPGPSPNLPTTAPVVAKRGPGRPRKVSDVLPTTSDRPGPSSSSMPTCKVDGIRGPGRPPNRPSDTTPFYSPLRRNNPTSSTGNISAEAILAKRSAGRPPSMIKIDGKTITYQEWKERRAQLMNANLLRSRGRPRKVRDPNQSSTRVQDSLDSLTVTLIPALSDMSYKDLRAEVKKKVLAKRSRCSWGYGFWMCPHCSHTSVSGRKQDITRHMDSSCPLKGLTDVEKVCRMPHYVLEEVFGNTITPEQQAMVVSGPVVLTFETWFNLVFDGRAPPGDTKFSEFMGNVLNPPPLSGVKQSDIVPKSKVTQIYRDVVSRCMGEKDEKPPERGYNEWRRLSKGKHQPRNPFQASKPKLIEVDQDMTFDEISEKVKTFMTNKRRRNGFTINDYYMCPFCGRTSFLGLEDEVDKHMESCRISGMTIEEKMDLFPDYVMDEILPRDLPDFALNRFWEDVLSKPVRLPFPIWFRLLWDGRACKLSKDGHHVPNHPPIVSDKLMVGPKIRKETIYQVFKGINDYTIEVANQAREGSVCLDPRRVSKNQSPMMPPGYKPPVITYVSPPRNQPESTSQPILDLTNELPMEKFCSKTQLDLMDARMDVIISHRIGSIRSLESRNAKHWVTPAVEAMIYRLDVFPTCAMNDKLQEILLMPDSERTISGATMNLMRVLWSKKDVAKVIAMNKASPTRKYELPYREVIHDIFQFLLGHSNNRSDYVKCPEYTRVVLRLTQYDKNYERFLDH